MKSPKIVLCSLLITPLALAGPDPQPQGKTFGEGLPKYLHHYDVKGGPNGEGDGCLDQEEIQAMEQSRLQIRKQLREDWDSDGDGQICAQEKEQAKLQLRQMIEEQRIVRFEEADTDGVPGLSLEEFKLLPGMVNKEPDFVQAVFDRLNTDGDEVISLAEFLAAVRQCDQDRDGSGDGKQRGGGSGDGGGNGGGNGGS